MQDDVKDGLEGKSNKTADIAFKFIAMFTVNVDYCAGNALLNTVHTAYFSLHCKAQFKTTATNETTQS